MLKCPACDSNETEKAKNDSGFFRSPTIKPIRVYQWRCLDCGYIAHYTADAPMRDSTDDLLAPGEIAQISRIGGCDDESSD